MSTQSPPSKPQQSEQTKTSDRMKGMLVLKEDVDPTDFKGSQLTTDCYYVFRTDKQVDLVRGGMVSIFDEYYDKGVTLTEIRLAGGSRNPKISKPEI